MASSGAVSCAVQAQTLVTVGSATTATVTAIPVASDGRIYKKTKKKIRGHRNCEIITS